MAVNLGTLRPFAGALLLAVLAACGGGDDDDGGTGAGAGAGTGTTSSQTTLSTGVEVYVGRWAVCVTENGGSSQELLEISRVTDTTAVFQFTDRRFGTADCTGTVLGTESGSGTVALVGKKTVGSDVADKANITENGQTEKQIFGVRSDGKLYVGLDAEQPGAILDAEGYPNAFDTDPFTKQ
jgi:hypothetical protein